jgi:hypothetical protein
MAFETGTATDYKDLLQKLKLFLTGQSVSPIGSNGLSWVVEEERSSFTSPLSDIPQGDADELIEVTAQNNQDHDQIIFRGNGGTSPEKEIYFGIQTYGLSTTGYYNWQIRGLTGFATSSPQYVKLADQPGRSPPVYLLLQNTTMTYWFVANNRRVMGVVKTGTAYHNFYIGFLNPYATDAEYPYPMMVAATAHEEDYIFSQNAMSVQGILNPGGSTTVSAVVQADLFPANSATAFVRFTDGSWKSVKNHSGDGGSETRLAHISGAVLAVYPFAAAQQSNHEEGNNIEDTHQWAQDWSSTTPGGTPTYQQLQSLGSPQQTVMWPITIFDPINEHFIGDVDGMYWVPAAGGFSSEDTITDTGESPEVIHYVFQNTWRTDAWTFFAMRWE